MHDPMIVLFDVKVPIPDFAWKSFGDEPRWGVRAFRRSNAENLGEFSYGWWRPKTWAVYMFGRRVRWRTIATVWHVEPDNHDSGEVCGRHPHGWRLALWTLRHFRHLSVRVHAWQAFKRWAWQRCAHCGGRSRRWMPVNVSHSWNSKRQQPFKSAPGMYHPHCSALVMCQTRLAEANEALHAMGVSALDLELRGFEASKAWRVPYYAEQDTEEARRG